MRKNSESEDKDPLRRVQKPQMKTKGYPQNLHEGGKLQFPYVSNCHYLTSFELIFDNYF